MFLMHQTLKACGLFVNPSTPLQAQIDGSCMLIHFRWWVGWSVSGPKDEEDKLKADQTQGYFRANN